MMTGTALAPANDDGNFRTCLYVAMANVRRTSKLKRVKTACNIRKTYYVQKCKIYYTDYGGVKYKK